MLTEEVDDLLLPLIILGGDDDVNIGEGRGVDCLLLLGLFEDGVEVGVHVAGELLDVLELADDGEVDVLLLDIGDLGVGDERRVVLGGIAKGR